MQLVSSMWVWGVITLSVGSVSAASTRGAPRTTPEECTCVPDQWQGVLSSLEREFDLLGGRTAVNRNDIHVFYDYKNKKFAMTEVATGSRAIADYAAGYKYVINGNRCHGMRTDEPMRQMCLPDESELRGEFLLGADIPVTIWHYQAPYNMTMETTVVQSTCIPISEEVYMYQPGYVSLTSSQYLDVTLGLKDMSVFDPPLTCMLQAHPPVYQDNGVNKRSRPDESLLRRMRSHIRRFN